MERPQGSGRQREELADSAEFVRGLGRRLSLPALEGRHDARHVISIFAFVSGCISIAVMSAAAVITRQPLIFPSLGPTAFLLFYAPHAAGSRPWTIIAGHAVGAASGYVSLLVFGLVHAGPALSQGVSWSRVGAASLSLGLTAGLMIWLRVTHAPAGATTLIVSLGIITRPIALLVLMLAVVVLVGQAFLLLRLAGVRYPALHRDEA